MAEFLQLLTKISVLVFVIASMAMMGVSLTVRQIVAPLRRVRLVLAALLANFVLVPLIAYLLIRVIPLDRSYAIGLLLLGGAAGAPFLPKLAELAKGDLAFSVTLMILLTVGSAVFMPLALPVLIPGLQADAWSIAQPLLVLMMLPLVVGLVLRARWERLSDWLKRALAKVSNISLILLTVLLIGRNVRILLGTVGTGAIAASALFVVLSLGVGYFLGGSDPQIRSVMGVGTAQRNIAAALVTATSNFSDPKVAAMLLVATIVGLVVLLIAARVLRRKAEPAPPADATERVS